MLPSEELGVEKSACLAFTYIIEQTRIDQSAADTITGIDGIEVRTVDDLLGESVLIRVLRKRQPVDVLVVLGTAE